MKFKPSVLSEFRRLSCSLIIIEHDNIVVILLGVAPVAVFEWRHLSSLAEFVLLDKNRYQLTATAAVGAARIMRRELEQKQQGAH